MELRGLSDSEMDEINAEMRRLYSEGRLTMLATEPVLQREWDTPQEDEAWKDL